MIETPDLLEVSGRLSERDVESLTTTVRNESGVFGPTTLYYAGVTAPAISAAMGFLTREILFDSHLFTPYWTNLLSAFAAALAGITWYTIFVRWSKRNKPGRASDLEEVTTIRAGQSHLSIRRGRVETLIDWRAVRDVRALRDAVVVFVDGAAAFIVPNQWFGDETGRQAEFVQILQRKAADHAETRS